MDYVQAVMLARTVLARLRPRN